MTSRSQLVDQLRGEAARHPPAQYPVQRATAQFHLGVALTAVGELAEADAVLREAARLFHGRLPVEHAKAANALGVALRDGGRLEEAAVAFAAAAEVFAGQRLGAEEGAAWFNLGLVRRAQADPGDARACFQRARGLLDRPAETAAATRELGATLLDTGLIDEAVATLQEAVELSDRAGDLHALSAAANALGLALLAAGRADEAADALGQALGNSPRSVRPESYAMVQANLALAHEQRGATARARLAARHALGVPTAPAPVRDQAAAILQWLKADPGDVLAVLDSEPQDAWPRLVRDELAWWLDAEPTVRRPHAAAWAARLAAEDNNNADKLAEAWLGAVLEVPPEGTEEAIGALVEGIGGLPPDQAERGHALVQRALPRFHLPQWQRLERLFARARAGAAG
ncbi:MAG TPA: tetratricopeptide repeat protein [Solirubrobacteraceae bacterium]|nr:tetratricopeptide repeat protein [Solirubrobacteraceae bacterium]